MATENKFHYLHVLQSRQSADWPWQDLATGTDLAAVKRHRDETRKGMAGVTIEYKIIRRRIPNR